MAQKGGIDETLMDSNGLHGNTHVDLENADVDPKNPGIDTETAICDHESTTRRGGRVAEGTGLLNRRVGYTGTAGSNPALSVSKKVPFHTEIVSWFARSGLSLYDM